MKLWNAADGKLIRTYQGHEGIVYSAAFFPDGKKIVTGSLDKTVKIWDVDTGSVLRSFDIGPAHAKAVAVFPDGQTIACATADYNFGAKTNRDAGSPIKLINTKTGLVENLNGHTAFINALAISEDGKIIASVGDDMHLIIWNVADHTIYKKIHIATQPLSSVAIHPSGDKIFVGAFDGTITVVGVADGKVLQTLREHKSNVASLSISHSGKLLASGGENDPSTKDNTLKLWDLGSLKVVDSFSGTDFGFHSVGFSPDEFPRLVTGRVTYSPRSGIYRV